MFEPHEPKQPSCIIEEVVDTPDVDVDVDVDVDEPVDGDGSDTDNGAEQKDEPASPAAAEDSEEPAQNQAAIDRQEYGAVPLTPPEDCIPITDDRGVLKKVLEPGSGDKPALHANCLVHYVGWLADSGVVFMDTRKDTESQQPVAVTAGRDSAAQEVGLCKAAATMTPGEVALVYVVDPVYGYGERGSFSFPAVPPNSRLVYRVEMLSWEAVEESDADRGTLLFEQRLERAERRRLQGNELFLEGKYKEALAKYAMALSYLDEDFMFQLEGHYLDKAEAVKQPIHLNMAAVQLKTGDYNTAIYNCSQVLNANPDNVKALFRRGRARHALGRTDEALQDLDAALKRDPSDKAIVAEMHSLRATIKKEREAEAKMFKGRFKAAPAASPDPAQQQQQGQASDSGTSPTGAGAGPGQFAKASCEIEPADDDAGAGSRAGAAGKRGGGGKGEVQRSWLVALLVWLWGLVLALLGLGPKKGAGSKHD